MIAFSAIVIPVAELDFVVRPRLGRALPEYLFGDRLATHAHITLLGPFSDQREVDDALLGRLAAFFGDTAPFGFSISGPPAMAGGAIRLMPGQPGPFRFLNQALWRDYPDQPPGDYAFTDYVPHVTLDYRPGVTALGDLFGQLAPVLPVHATAEVACLHWYEPGKSKVMATFRLGGRAARA